MRTSLNAVGVAICLLTAIPAALAGPKNAAVEAAVDKAVADWTPVLTCSATLPPEVFQVQEIWTKDREEIASILIKGGVAPEVITRIASKTEPANMMTAAKGSAADLIAYCKTQTGWVQALQTFAIASLKRDVEKALDAP